MKLLPKLALLNLLCFTAFPTSADDATSAYNQQQMSSSIQELVQYLQYWGQYVGYDITTPPQKANQNFNFSQTLINLTTTQLAQVSLFYTYLGAIPVNSLTTQFVPTEVTNSSILNPYANATFQSDTSALTSSGAGVNPLIDQTNQSSQSGQSGQQNQASQAPDPVSQAVINIVGTPDYSYCMSYDGSTWDQNCTYLTETLVADNVIGTLPDATTFFSYSYIQQFLSQLNGNSLIAPLMYGTESAKGGSAGTTGLTADNQAQQAANFIRYVSGGVAPIKLPNWKQYDTLYAQATSSSTSTTVTPVQQHQAQDQLSRYLASLRTYAAQNSVGMSNLYYILSKRLPQTPKEPVTNYVQIPSSPPSSEALNEFNMATWRIFNAPSQSGQQGQPGNTQWINQINNSSSATVEKELAVLLAEMNYQLYLNRQVQERILLTNTILLLQSIRQTAPSSDFSQPAQQ